MEPNPDLRFPMGCGIMVQSHRRMGEQNVEPMEQLGRFTLRQRDGLPKMGTDSVQLARFATLHRRDKVLDLGCGVGVLGVLLARRAEELRLDGVELHPEAAALARENLRENGLAGDILCQDLREPGWFSQGHYDLIVSNPPYFPLGSGKVATRRPAGARSEQTCTLSDLCRAAGPRLKTGGRFALCIRPERLTDLMIALRENRLEPKRMQLVQYHETRPPKLALLEAVRQGGPGLRVEPVLLLKKE